jgi:Subtilase family
VITNRLTSKNVITVGAGENVRQTGTDGCGIANSGADSANDIIGFSSRGPVNSAGGDGRIKPDIVAPGTHIEAGVPQSNYDGSSVCNQFFPAGQQLYGWSSGTSHSTPAVAGGATGSTNSPVSVPVTLTVNAAGGAELIVNGGFEGSAAPWTLTGEAVWSQGGNHRSGTGYLILGGANNTSRAAFQQITIPSGTSPSLNFWLNVTSTETTTTTQFDRFFVEVRSTSGALLATLATFSNLNKVTPTNAYTLRGAYNLSSFAGQTVRIQFRATTDSSLITSFRVDDVSVR